MSFIKSLTCLSTRSLIFFLTITIIFNCIACNGDSQVRKKGEASSGVNDSADEIGKPDEYLSVNKILVLPKNPRPEEPFRILVTGRENIRKEEIIVQGPSGNIESMKSKTGEEFPYWRIDDFPGSPEGKYRVTVTIDNKELSNTGVYNFATKSRSFTRSCLENPAWMGQWNGRNLFCLDKLLCFMVVMNRLHGLHFTR